uniref:DEK-C domain-containing protein n=1 Tax=Kalanchoe fedtschenkoi TaxID=63787 RepID=A0A7N0RC44_KALFE
MGEENAADNVGACSDIANAVDSDSNLPGKPEESMMEKKKEKSPREVNGQNSGVEVIKELESRDDKMEEDSKAEGNTDYEVVIQNDENKEAVEQEHASEEVVPEEVVSDQINLEILEQHDEADGMGQRGVVEPKCENIDPVAKSHEFEEEVPLEVVGSDQVNEETLEQHNEPDDIAQQGVVNMDMLKRSNGFEEMMPPQVVKKDEECSSKVGEDSETKELAAPENQVNFFAEEQKPKEETSDEITGNTKALNEDGQITKFPRDVHEEELQEDEKLMEGKVSGDAADKPKLNNATEENNVTSETLSMEVERNSEKKEATVGNGLETEQAREICEGPTNEENKGKEDIGSKKRKRGENAVDKTNSEQGQATPVNSASLRPVRERKSVERLVASIEKDIIREIFVEKGAGVALKDIPNVAYKLSKKRNDETIKQLHTILFGRRGKAIQMKNHVSQFSGFVWHDNEEKNRMKVKEKFDKFVKEKLLEFCDVLDIPITNKVATRKEDVVTKIMEFLSAPHATTDVLLSEKEKSEKTKRKRAAGQGSPTLEISEGSWKRRRKTKGKLKEGVEDDANIDGELNIENEGEVVKGEQRTGNGKQKQSEESSEKYASLERPSESEDAMDEDAKHHSQRSKKTSAKVESSAKTRTKPDTPKKPDLEKATVEDAKYHKKSSKSAKTGSTRKTVKKSDTPGRVGVTSKSVPHTDKKALSSKVTTGKKNQAESVKEKISVSSDLSIKKKIVKTDPKFKPKEEKLKPSNKVLRDQICQILKEVDFNTATFTDILKLLVEHFKTDLTLRKASIKVMIQEELTKMADDEEDGEPDVTTALKAPKVDC